MMKRLIAVLALTGLLAGCMTAQQKEWTCETAQNAYAAYQAVIAAGHTPSQEEIYAATAGATFLRLWCGWTAVQPETQVRAMSLVGPGSGLHDGYMVPIIMAPR